MAISHRIPATLWPTALLLLSSAGPVPILRPGSADLSPVRSDSAATFEVRRIRPGDSLPHPVARLTTSWALVAGDSGALSVVASWSAPVSSLDSLVFDRRTLAPREERLSSPGLRFRYHYDGSRISGSLERGDSAPRAIERSFDGPVFAFNEVDVLAQSLRHIPATFVVPLFSESDADLELDTLSVVTDTTVAGRPAWVVRFADPVIVQRYVIDSATRRTLRLTTRQRKSGTVFDATP